MRLLVIGALCLLGCATSSPASSRAGASPASAASNAKTASPRWGMVIHGGAGNLDPAKLPPEKQAAYRAKLEEALRAGHAVLAKGGESLDAVVAALSLLEDSPLFNAGKGAVFTHDGKNELDASIMDGARRRAGAVAAVHRIKNPIQLARRVMDDSPHVMLVGDGAEQFAQSLGIPLVDPSYFFTQTRWDQLQQALAEERAGKPQSSRGESEPVEGGYQFGTVGAVALDQSGRLAAGTSTGGMTNKRYGRVGDSPIIGAGTYADARCAISATGHGEFFIRYTVAKDICARVEYLHQPLREAAAEVIRRELVEVGGEGGVIALDSDGNVAMTFNTTGMFRGTFFQDGAPRVEIFQSGR